MPYMKVVRAVSFAVALLVSGGATGFEPATGSEVYVAVLRAVIPLFRRDIDPEVGVNVEEMKVEGDWAYAQFVPIDSGGPIDWSKTKFAADHAAGRMSPWVFALLHKDAAGEWQVLEYRIGAKTADWPTWIARHHPPDALVSAAGKASAPVTTPPAVPPVPAPSSAESSPPQAIGAGAVPPASSDAEEPRRKPDAASDDEATTRSPEKIGREVTTSAEARAAKLTADGEAAYAVHDDVTALARYDEALAIHPNFTLALKNRAKVYARANDLIRAMADLDRAIEIDPRYADAFNNRGTLWVLLKDSARAKADFDKTIEIAPRTWQAHVNRARLLIAEKRWDAALADFDAAIEINPKFDWIFTERGNLQFERKHYEEAISDYGRAFAIKPRAFHLVNRAIADLALGRLAEAVYETSQAIAMDPKIPSAYYIRARARFRSKDFAAAIIDLDVAIDLKSEARFFAWRSAAYRALARPAEADRDLVEARRLDPKVKIPTTP